MPSYQDILKQIDHLTKEAERIRQAEVGAAIADIRAKMAEYGIQPSDILGKDSADSSRTRRTSTGAKKVAPKYRGSKGELWTGRGRRPAWVVAELAKGRSIEDLSI